MAVRVWPALLVVILLLIVAAMSERWIEARRNEPVCVSGWRGWPVLLLALVVFLIAGAQISAVRGALGLICQHMA